MVLNLRARIAYNPNCQECLTESLNQVEDGLNSRGQVGVITVVAVTTCDHQQPRKTIASGAGAPVASSAPVAAGVDPRQALLPGCEPSEFPPDLVPVGQPMAYSV